MGAGATENLEVREQVDMVQSVPDGIKLKTGRGVVNEQGTFKDTLVISSGGSGIVIPKDTHVVSKETISIFDASMTCWIV